jgi:lipopolysaccharide export LptBFGC system permease protein LptF
VKPLPESEKSRLAERLVQALLRKAMDTLFESTDRYFKKLIRSLAMIVGGIAIALFGAVVIAIGDIKWLSKIMPTWLSWVLVGITLLLIGIELVALNK